MLTGRVITMTGSYNPTSVVAPDMNGRVKVLWTIPKTPPSLNQWERMHWGMRNRTKEAWEEYVFSFSRKDALPSNAAWVYVSAQIVFRKGAHRDLSNFDATFWKIFPDVLQRVGVLEDDTEEYMRRGKVTMMVDKALMGKFSDPRLQGMTRIAVIAQAKS